MWTPVSSPLSWFSSVCHSRYDFQCLALRVVAAVLMMLLPLHGVTDCLLFCTWSMAVLPW